MFLNLTHEEIIRIYNEESGQLWADVDKEVEKAVPETIFYNGLEYNHMSVYFRATTLEFAYFSQLDENNHGFIYLSKEEAIKHKVWLQVMSNSFTRYWKENYDSKSFCLYDAHASVWSRTPAYSGLRS